MAMKMRVLYYSQKGKMIGLADALRAKFDCNFDVIPPAYPCDNHRLVFIGITSTKEIPNQLRLFCNGLKKNAAHNVAFFIDGPKEAAVEIMNYVRSAGANVIDDVYYVKSGFSLKFMTKISDDERKGIVDWATKIYDSVSQ